MPPNPSRPGDQPGKAVPRPPHSRKRRLVTLAYAVGLILVFLLSLLLLPDDSGLGKLLWGSLTFAVRADV